MAIEINDGGLLRAMGIATIPALTGQPCGLLARGVVSATCALGGIMTVELDAAISQSEFHASATYAADNDVAASTPIVVAWINETHFRITAPGISNDQPCSVYFAIRRIAGAVTVGTNTIPALPA